ncbi:MAG TPA: TetR/AcrR family transcriptional regulator [Caulobacteraceae bacterium]|nr:TetR/AcrR family transcriptional regulator [Caulobacteraceae bacterium]
MQSTVEATFRAKRRRRTAADARAEALAAARALLIEGGPAAVTLKAVGARVGVTHANLIHHFGSAAELHSALMGQMIGELTDAIDDIVARLRSDEGAPRALVDEVFDVFAAGGAGPLAAWIVLAGELESLAPVQVAVRNLVEAIHEKFALPGEDAHRRVTAAVLFIALTAFGDAVIGAPLKRMMDRSDDATRKLVAMMLPTFLA